MRTDAIQVEGLVEQTLLEQTQDEFGWQATRRQIILPPSVELNWLQMANAAAKSFDIEKISKPKVRIFNVIKLNNFFFFLFIINITNHQPFYIIQSSAVNL